ncbi:MAG TPA: hypothetical protein VNM14_25230 [Planctomycetota bacterium]|nr:hypothetical protein [Planctomycetota bacterium]
MRTTILLLAMAAALAAAPQDKAQDRPFTDSFLVDEKDFVTTGRNPYFILEPGYQLVLENKKKKEVLVITVLEETKKIGGIETRVIEEHESVDGKPVEISRNFFAICKRSNSVYYFGEEVDEYKDGKVAGHPGAWLHGDKGAHYGLMMPGLPLVGARYYQEVAPKVAMDRAEILSVSDTFECPAGKFEKVLTTEETTPLEPAERAHKKYAPGVGLLSDGDMTLVKYGPKATK